MAGTDLVWLWVVLGIAAAVIAIIVIWAVWAYNRFVSLRNDIEEAASTIQVYEKKRFDLVPNLVTAVKGYAAHETAIFERVTAARENVLSAKTPEAREKGEAELTAALSRLLAVAEAYPDLKASVNFLDLQGQLGQIEDQIANARKYYNANVRMYNTRLEVWPSSIIAKKNRFRRMPLYEAPDQAERENVKVQF